MLSQSILKNSIRFILRYMTASALIIFLSTPLHAAPEAILRLNMVCSPWLIQKLAITQDSRFVTVSSPSMEILQPIDTPSEIMYWIAMSFP